MPDIQEDDMTQAAVYGSDDFLRGVKNRGTVPVSEIFSRAVIQTYFDTLYEPIGGGGDGWTAASETWTRTGNYTYTIATDVTAKYHKRTKIRYKDGGAFEYGVIHSSVFGSPNTTVTLITNADYTMAAATITDKYISYQDAPQGFPSGFNFTPTVDGFTSDPSGPTSSVYRWSVRGGVCRYSVFQGLASNTSDDTVLTITSPVTALNVTNYTQYASIPYVIDNGAQIASGIALIGANSALVTTQKSAGAAWTNSSTKAVRFQIDIEFQ